jgi:hypothetical protein
MANPSVAMITSVEPRAFVPQHTQAGAETGQAKEHRHERRGAEPVDTGSRRL